MSAPPEETAIPSPLALFAGHPRGLPLLCFVQMWERFSFYGMRALLVLYLAEDLLRPERAGSVLGYRWLESALTTLFGPLSPQAMSSQIYGLYGGLVFFTPIFGSWIADRHLGQRRSVFLGGLLIALGHALMAFDATFLLALLAIILGSGLFTPAISAQVGALYEPADSRRDRAFSLFYVGINVGAMIAPIVCGTVGETVGWHAGFSLAALGMVAGLVAYWRGAATLPADQPGPAAGSDSAETGKFPLFAVLVLMLVSSLFWTSYGQIGNVLNFWLRDDSNLVLAGIELKITWFQSLNPLFILIGTPLVVAAWARAAVRGREPSTMRKMALGSFFLAAAFFLLAAIATPSLSAQPAHWAWTVLAIALMTLGELYLAPTSWSLFSRLAPAGREAFLMGLWLLPLFIGGYLSGLVGAWWEPLGAAPFWLVSAGIALTGTIVMLLLRPRLRLPEAG